ncbi:MAG: tyrosine-type recombinase/integrase [Gracilibacteraceae bacterium]|jgi:integrase|nr:tyrosine-type recombinase/integrase [Gracilibacteraceae bacterium]
MATTQPIRQSHHIRRLAGYYLQRGQLRNHLLVVMGVGTALRISDLLRVTWDDVYDFYNARVRESFSIKEGKSGKTKIVSLNRRVVAALTLFAAQAARRGRLLMENPLTGRAISRVQAYRIIRAAGEITGIGRVSCHSLRKTFGYHAWKSGVSPAVIVEIYNHSSLAITRQYLGVSQDDQNEVYQKMSDLF